MASDRMVLERRNQRIAKIIKDGMHEVAAYVAGGSGNIGSKAAALHPHTNCPHCAANNIGQAVAAGPAKSVGDDELVMFFLNNVGKRSMQENIERFRKLYDITRRS